MWMIECGVLIFRITRHSSLITFSGGINAGYSST